MSYIFIHLTINKSFYKSGKCKVTYYLGINRILLYDFDNLNYVLDYLNFSTDLDLNQFNDSSICFEILLIITWDYLGVIKCNHTTYWNAARKNALNSLKLEPSSCGSR